MVGLMKVKEAVLLLEHQVPLPVENYVVRLSKCLDDDTYGDCVVSASGDMVTIRIDKSVQRIAQIDSLIHEWAHAMLAGTHEFAEHGPVWGVCYAKCYRALYPD